MCQIFCVKISDTKFLTQNFTMLSDNVLTGIESGVDRSDDYHITKRAWQTDHRQKIK
jgi:hypothetical protein